MRSLARWYFRRVQLLEDILIWTLAVVFVVIVFALGFGAGYVYR